MNILLSYNWLKEHVATKKDPKELSRLLSLHSMSVERILNEVPLLTNKIVLGEITKISQHPNADKLQIAMVSTGKEEHKVVCGAPNIFEGMKVAFAHIGAMVQWHGEGDPVELKPATIRGEESFGMICADAEIGLSKVMGDGVGDFSAYKAALGTPLAKVLGYNDAVLDIEITTNRIDAASTAGMAREVAAMTGEKLLTETQDFASIRGGKDKPLKITIEDKEKCLGFNGVVLTDIKVGSSPEWLQRRLRAAGHSVFNNVVDITNYVMREYGHPLHAFDYDAVEGGELVIRAAKKNEKLIALDDSELTLNEKMVVVADPKKNLSLGGVMGGKNSMITEETTTVLLEAASWNPQVIRKTMMKLDKFSDAGSYFNKGVSPQLSQGAFAKAVELLIEHAGAKVASPVVSKGYKTYKPKTVEMRLSQAEKFIGSKLNVKTITKQLEALGFEVQAKKETLICTVPHWRQYDVSIEEDLIEEVARMYGYQNIEDKLPSGELPRPVFDPVLEAEEKLEDTMQALGFNEVYTYSMVSEELHALGGRYQDEAIRLINPLDDGHAVMRTSLVPSMLEVAAQNQGVVDKMHLFEIANVYEPVGKNKLPNEVSMLCGLIMTGDAEKDFREAKGVMNALLNSLGLGKEIEERSGSDFSLVRSNASLHYMLEKEWAGLVGVIESKAAKAVGLKGEAVVFLLPVQDLAGKAHHGMEFTPIPKFPAVQRDLSVVVEEDMAWGRVEAEVKKAAGGILDGIELFDVYHQEDGKKSFAFHLWYRDDEKTLEMKDIEPVQELVIAALEKKLGAKLKA